MSFTDVIATDAYPADIHAGIGGGLVHRLRQDDLAYQTPFRGRIPTALDNASV